MEFSDFVYLGLFALWLYSQVAAVAKKNKERQRQKGRQHAAQQQTAAPPPTVALRPTPRRQQQQQQGEGLLSSLSDLEQETEATLLELDEKVRAQVSFLVDNDYREKAQALRSELRNESSPEFARASQETQWLLSHYRGLLQTARIHSGIRQRRELQGPRVIADHVAAELDQPRNVGNPLPPPVAIVWDVAASDRLRESALADATLFVPRTVAQDPTHWSLMAPEMARYLGASAPTLYQDIYEGLGLGADEAQVGNDPAALTRVLFASWIGRIAADAMGALFFGPSYLHAVARLYAQPGAPARVSAIVVNRDGTVHTEPPAHVRVHVTARWVTRMGYASEAAAIRSVWDERHGSPDAFAFSGSMTSFPAAPVLAAASQLTDELFQLPLDAFGKVRLADVPGLAGWENHARQATAATASLLGGERAQGSARAIVAGAIEAALTDPEANTKIHAALYESLSTVQAHTPKPTAKRKARARATKPVATGQPFANLAGRDVAEALILGEILLEPSARLR
ncbi:MAG: hypothetical protein BMS9Abin37_0872 [Acidobacteriota bacterium]|nr:MAG: hypothetical protein BMS9Abin37_0872 [Acidobacteriota bacterium]